MAFLLPLHAWTLWRRLQLARPDEAPPPSQWWFRHVYLASGLFLMVQVLALDLFDYQEIALWRHAAEERSARASAAATAAFGLGYAVIVSILLAIVIAHRPERFRLLGKGSWTLAKCLRQAVLALVLSYCVAFLSYWALPGALTLDRMIQSMVEIYGLPLSLFAIAVLIPIAEEILFRWILLDVLARNLRFWVANAVQAVLFAALHADPKRLLFYTVVGLLSGRMRRASGGLLPSILFHGANNAIALLLLVAMRTGAVPDKRALQRADPELAACSKARGNPLGNATFALPLNNLAWSIAIDPSSSVPCLRKAEEAIDAALRQVPDGSGFLDTKATILYRLGRLDEAIEIERVPIDSGRGSGFHLSQVDRFLRAREPSGRPLLLGDAAPSPVSVGHVSSGGRKVSVELGSAFPDGVVIYARERPGGGFFTFATGPGHKESYDLDLQVPASDTSTFEVALVDSRGCEECTGGSWQYEFARHDSSVDPLP
jgi:membrane protease YdiL (CAAX protease family)